MQIHKTRDVKTPERGTPQSAGIDFFVPNDFPGTHYLAANQSVKIPSGIHMKVPNGFALVFMNKSGMAIKGLQVGACVVDADFQGEVHLHVTNIGNDLVEIKPGMKLVQGLILSYLSTDILELNSLEELYSEKTQRGEGGFGSTGDGIKEKFENTGVDQMIHKVGDTVNVRPPYHHKPFDHIVVKEFKGKPSDNLHCLKEKK